MCLSGNKANFVYSDVFFFHYYCLLQELMSLLSPISNKIQEITEFREKNRRSEYFNHLSAISESIAALGKNLLVLSHARNII